MDHTKFMAAALKEAQKALKTGDIPIGAVAVVNGRIIARAHNEKEKRIDATAHAEMLCLQKAAKKIKTWRLTNVSLYTTLEPCPMCAGAMVLARIRSLVYANKDPKAGAAKSVINIINNKKLNHRIRTSEFLDDPVLKEECKEIIKGFFKKLRK